MLDIRIPIGLMFSILGGLITLFGLFTVSDTAMYQKSFGLNVNIFMGILMLVFGIIMLYFSRRKKNS